MRTINLDEYRFKTSGDQKHFIVLGYKKAEKTPAILKQIVSKVKNRKKVEVPSIWGTLGFSDDTTINWSGNIDYSGGGNRKFEGIIHEEVKQVKQLIPGLKAEPGTIIERFISFENVDFKFPEVFSTDQIPTLRLDVMLGGDEGAVVFYQFHKNNNKAEHIEYIQPQPTKGNRVDQRDRLTYLFKVIPPYQLEPVNEIPGHYSLNKKEKEDPFIVKVITFKRTFDELKDNKKLDSTALITYAQNELNKIIQNSDLPKDHRLLVFNRSKNDFAEAKATDIDASKKTLLLLHGTFGDTESSFGDLYGKNNNWLLTITDSKVQGYYEQVISFDHPTLFFGAKENIDKMFELLDELKITDFLHEVDVMGTSQGGLLVQYLANLSQSRIKVGKAVLVASANGVGYLEVGENLSKFLSALRWIMKKLGKPHIALISAIAQHSVDFLLNQQGFQIMTPGHEKLNEIINQRPVRKETLYLPIINDYDKSLMDSDNKLKRFFRRLFGNVVDFGARSMLGTYNDWVVGTKNQYLVPPEHCAIQNYNPFRFKDQMVVAIHGHTFENSKAKEKIQKFFLGLPFEKIQDQPPTDLFDAHCHIFGRSIINTRILFLLLEDILGFLKKKDELDKLPVITGLREDEESEKESGSWFINIMHYFVLNKDSFHVLDDLESEYDKLDSGVFRYIPLMFDLEMTFRTTYLADDSTQNTLMVENDFIKAINKFLKTIEDLITRVEEFDELVFEGNLQENLDSIKYLKVIRKIIKAFNLDKTNLSENVTGNYEEQIKELIILKNRYGNNLFPFLAVDPRRKNMAKIIKENVGADKPFRGIKLYAPNGYSPTDPHLFDPATKFIDDTCLYQYCINNNIPIMAHCSDAGFSTFVEELEVWGDIHVNGKIEHFDKPTRKIFNKNIPFKFKKGVRERADVLNHPKLWEIVLSKYNELTICFAHFGGESVPWQNAIAALMDNRDNVYTDLSCITTEKQLIQIKKGYYNTNNKIINRIMYGSDFFFNMLGNIEFKDYYKHFTKEFTKAQLQEMSLAIPKRYLGI